MKRLGNVKKRSKKRMSKDVQNNENVMKNTDWSNKEYVSERDKDN